MRWPGMLFGGTFEKTKIYLACRKTKSCVAFLKWTQWHDILTNKENHTRTEHRSVLRALTILQQNMHILMWHSQFLNWSRSSKVIFPLQHLDPLLISNLFKQCKENWDAGDDKRKRDKNNWEPELFIWSKFLDVWTWSLYIIPVPVLFTWLYNIFLNVEAVHRLENFPIFFSLLELALAWWFSVSLGSHCYVLLQHTIASLFLPNKDRWAWRQGGRVQETVPGWFSIGDLWDSTRWKICS